MPAFAFGNGLWYDGEIDEESVRCSARPSFLLSLPLLPAHIFAHALQGLPHMKGTAIFPNGTKYTGLVQTPTCPMLFAVFRILTFWLQWKAGQKSGQGIQT
jgi:hypothetical protein